MITLFTLIHILVCVFLILVVLLQQGKGQDFASTFGGGGTQTAFGARGSASILHRMTTASAVVFMITSMALTIIISQPGAGSVITEDAVPVTAPAAETVTEEPAAPEIEIPAPAGEPEAEAEPDN